LRFRLRDRDGLSGDIGWHGGRCNNFSTTSTRLLGGLGDLCLFLRSRLHWLRLFDRLLLDWLGLFSVKDITTIS
jgi:hypothetical protein